VLCVYARPVHLNLSAQVISYNTVYFSYSKTVAAELSAAKTISRTACIQGFLVITFYLWTSAARTATVEAVQIDFYGQHHLHLSSWSGLIENNIDRAHAHHSKSQKKSIAKPTLSACYRAHGSSAPPMWINRMSRPVRATAWGALPPHSCAC
jgi:hypothetical protein